MSTRLDSSATRAGHGFEKVILRLVKGGAERRAIEAGEIDAILDPASGSALLLPEAQRSIVARKAGMKGLVGLSSDWYWEQDEEYRFVSHTGAAAQSSESAELARSLLGKTLWDLSIDNISEADWRTHRQQLDWRATYRDLEVRLADPAGLVRYLSFSGEPVVDVSGVFTGYRGITRDITARRQAEATAHEANRFARATLDAVATQIAVLDGAGRVLLANDAWRVCAAAHAGVSAGIFEGANYLTHCDAAAGSGCIDATAIAAGIRQVIAGERELFRYEHPLGASLAGPCWYLLTVTGLAEESSARVVISREDVTLRKRAEILLSLEYRVAGCVADAASAPAAVKSVIRAVCESQGWDCGRYFRFDAATGVLRFDHGWSLPLPAVERFLEQSRTLVFRPGAGLTGRVYQSGQPLWVTDGARDGGVSLTALAPETGMEGAFVMPVMADGRIIGVLAFASRTVCAPDDRMLQAAESIGSQLGRFLLRQQGLDELRACESHLRRVIELSSDWYWEQDSGLRFTKLVGCGVAASEDALGKTSWELPGIVPAPERWDEHKSQLAARWSFCDFEFAAQRPDGQLAHFSISGEPFYDESGAFAGYCGTGLDITQRKRAEIALRESEARLRAQAGA